MNGLVNKTISAISTVLRSGDTPEFVTKTVELAKTASGWLTGAVGVVTVLMAIYFVIKRQTADDEADEAKYRKKFKSALFWGIVGTVITGVITWLLTYYT